MKFNITTSQFGRIAALLFLCSLFAVGTAFAQGRVTIKSTLETGYQRDSNFHKTDDDTQTVDTFYIKPGIQFGYLAPKSSVTVNYWANNYNYSDKDTVAAGNLDADDLDYTEHQLVFGAQIQPADRLQIGLDNFYKNTRDPSSTENVTNDVETFKYSMNKFTPWLNYRFGEKFGLGLKYTNSITDYSDDAAGEGEDTDENRGTFTFFYYFTPKTSFNLDYQHWTRDYDKNTSGYDSDQFMANVKHQFNYLTFGAGAGYHKRDFAEAVTGGDLDVFTWKLSLLGQNPPDAVEIPRHSVYLALSSSLNDMGSGDTYYDSTRLDAKITYLLMDKFNFTFKTWFQTSDYETSAREDDKYFVSGAVDYLINDFFTIGLEGGKEERDSNVDGKDYDNDFIKFNISVAYDFGSK